MECSTTREGGWRREATLRTSGRDVVPDNRRAVLCGVAPQDEKYPYPCLAGLGPRKEYML